MSVFSILGNVSFVSEFEPKPKRVILGTFSSEKKALESIDKKIRSLISSVMEKEDGDLDSSELSHLYEEYAEMFTIVETKIDDESKFQELNSSTFMDSFLVY